MSVAPLPMACWVCVLAAACSGDARTIELRRVVPEADPDCGAPGDAISLQVTALGDFPADRVNAVGAPLAGGTRFDLGALPAETRVLRVSVFGDTGARAIGKTVPFVLDDLASGDQLTVFMTPPEGLCPTGPPRQARSQPILARAGTGVVIAGGLDSAGIPVGPVELYDASRGSFAEIATSLYAPAEHGLVGATATALPPGPGPTTRVVIAGGGGSGYQVYDVADGQLSAAFLLDPGRARHAALALDQDRLFLAGGCALPLDPPGQCRPGQLHDSTTLIDLAAGTMRPGPRLTLARRDALLVRESQDTVLFIGGLDDAGQPVTQIERLHLDASGPGEVWDSPAAAGAATALASGGVFAGFAPSGQTPAGEVFIVPPGTDRAVSAGAASSPRSGVALAALQNGQVLVVGGGGSGSGEILVYEPARSRFRALPGASFDLADAGAIALADGSVLVTGGRSPGGTAAREAWIVRTDLTGPYSTGVDLSFGVAAGGLVPQWIPSDPDQITIVPAAAGDLAHAALTATGMGGGLPSDWAVVAGPEFSRATVRVLARSLGGGIAVLVGFRGPEDYTALVLLPGQVATLFTFRAGQLFRAECAAETVTTDLLLDRDDSAAIEVTLDRDALAAAIDDRTMIDCRDLEPLATGVAGVGAVGAAGESIRVDSITITRR